MAAFPRDANRTLLTFLLLMLVSTVASHAQQADSAATHSDSYGIIDSVLVSGNEKTKDYVILDEMSLRRGVEATFEGMEYDRNRIYSLGLFTRVDLRCDSLGGKLLLHVDVAERWYLIPFPVFGFSDGDPKKPYYGGGLLHNNFGGRNQKLFGLVTLGYNPSLSLSFHDPLMDREYSLYFSGALSYTRVRNKSLIESSVSGDFNELHYRVNATLGKRFSLYETSGLTVGYQVVIVEEYRPGRTLSPSGRDAFLFATLAYAYDSRDLREYASEGHFLYLAVTKYGLGDAALSFTRFNLDARTYRPLPWDLTLAARLHGTIVSGSFIPTYARVYFGYGERIRGYFRNVLEGEDMTGGSVELRYPLLKPRTIYFTAIPLPQEFAIWRFGINLALFADTGLTWFRGQGIRWSDFSSGYGGGIHFLLPYSTVVRTEYAYNELFRGQFILDLRASF